MPAYPAHNILEVTRPVSMTDFERANSHYEASLADKFNPYDLLRPDFGSPEAIQSFLLHAYRPPGPSRTADVWEEKSTGLKSKSALTLEIRSDSFKPTAGLHRTDIPLVDMFANAQPAGRKSCSLPNAIPAQHSRLDSIDLPERSDSAPARLTVEVAEIWAGIPDKPCRNPFDHVMDSEGLFL